MKNKHEKYVQPKSVIRVVLVKMREQNAKTLEQKKQVFTNVLSESTIQPWTAKYMINKVSKMRSHKDFDSYLINSMHYFEKNFLATAKK